MIAAHEIETTVDSTGSVHVTSVPFGVGERVRVLIEPMAASTEPRHTAEELRISREILDSLKGSLLRYDGPDEPVGADEWHVLRTETSDAAD